MVFPQKHADGASNTCLETDARLASIGGTVVNDNSSTLRQRELGKQLRGLRNPRGLTLDEVAQCLEWSATKISRFETGLRCPTLRDVRYLCYLYKVSEPGCVKL